MKKIRVHFTKISPESSLRCRRPEQNPALPLILQIWDPRLQRIPTSWQDHNAGQDGQKRDLALQLRTDITVCFL